MTLKTVIVTLSGGGYENEAIMLLRGLGDRFDYVYVTSTDAAWRPATVPIDGRTHILPAIIRKMEPSKIKAMGNFLYGTAKAAKIVLLERPHAIIGVASPICLPLFIWGRLIGSKCIFVESITRTEKLSLTGRLAARFFLVHRIYVQWADLTACHPKAVYGGTVL